MPNTETTTDFTYDEELLTELAMAAVAARRVTGDVALAVAVLSAYKDIKIAKFHQQQDWSLIGASGGEDPENGY